MTIQSTTAISLLRMVIACIMISHGCMRIYLDGVWGFGEFLTSRGIPLGTIVAWGMTVFEIIGGTALLAGKFVKPISLVFIVHLAAGILLVHLPSGWFVVGAGRNGIEYSVLLITAFLTVALSRPRWN